MRGIAARTLACLAVVLSIVFASTAHAALPLPVVGPVLKPGPVAPATSVPQLAGQVVNGASNTLANNIGLGTLGEMVACPVTTSLRDVAPPGADGTLQSAQFVACALHFLDFEWRTKHPGPKSILTNDRIVTTIGVPTPLNMDGDELPELLATVLIHDVNKFSINFRRIDVNGLLDGDLPGEAELIVTDPTRTSLPVSHIGVGMNSFGGRTPNGLSVIFTLESFQRPFSFTSPPRFKVEIEGSRQPERASIFGDLFDEDFSGNVRDSMLRGTVGLTPVPKNLTARIGMRDDKGVDATLTSTETTTVDAHAIIHGKPAGDGTRRRQSLNAVFQSIPTYMAIRYRPLAPTTPAANATPAQKDAARGGQDMTYSANATMPKMDVNYDDEILPAPPSNAAPTPTIRAHLGITSLPSAINFSQIGSVTDFNTGSGKIGRTEAELALNGDLKQLRTPRPGARFLREKGAAGKPDPLYIAGRIDGIRNFHMDTLGGRTVLDVGIDEQPFDLDMRDDINGLTATGAIENLPANTHIEYLPGQPASDNSPSTPLRFKYDAGDHTIALIKFKASFDQTISNFLDEIEGHIKNLPPVIDVKADLVGKVYEFKASKPFGEIQAMARNRKAINANVVPPLSAGVTGASAIIRNDGTFAALGRIQGLKHVLADLDHNEYTLEVGAVPLEVRALVDEVRGTPPNQEVLQRDMIGTVDQLPSYMHLKFDEEGDQEKVISYDANSRIGEIALQLTGDKLFAPQPKVNKVRAKIIDSPAAFTARLGNAGKLDLDASGPDNQGIGGIEALVTSGPDPVFPQDHHQAYVETGQNVTIKAFLKGFKRFKLEPDPVDVLFKTKESLPLEVDAKLDLDNDTNHVAETEGSLDIVNVPASINVNFQRQGKIHYAAQDANGGPERIQSITAHGKLFEDRGQGPLQRVVDAQILGVPSTIDLELKTDNADKKSINYDADGQTDSISLEAVGPKLYAGEEKINRIKASVEGIPAHLAASFGGDSSIDLDAGTGINKIGALITSGPDPAFAANQHQAYIETGQNIVAKAQLLGFKKFSLTPEPSKIHFETAQSLPLQVDAKLDLDSADNVDLAKTTAGVSIKNVPSSMDFLLDGDGKFEYDASSDINSIDIFADGLPDIASLPVKIKRIDLNISGIPRQLDASFANNQGFNFKARDVNNNLDAVDSIQVDAKSATPPALPATAASSHVLARQVGNQINARVKVVGLREIGFKPTPLDVVVDTDVLGALDVDAAQDANNAGGFEKSVLAKLRSNIKRVTVQDITDGSGRRIDADTGSPLGSLDVLLKADNLPMGVHTVSALLENLPEFARLKLPNGGIDFRLMRRDGNGNLITDGTSNGLDLLDVSVNGGEPRSTIVNRNGATVPSDGAEVKMTGGNIDHAGVQIHGFRGFSFQKSPYTAIGADLAYNQSRPWALDADVDGKTATGHIDKLPSNLLVELSPVGDTPVRYSGDQRIDQIKLDTTFSSLAGIPGAQIDIRNVAKHFSVCFRTDGQRASCTRTTQTAGQGYPFNSVTDRKISAAYASDNVIGDPQTTIHAVACFDQGNCGGGRIATVDVKVPRRIELEAGASAHGPADYPFDCFDDSDITTIIGDIACMFAYPVNYIANAIATSGAHAFVWFDTGSTNLDGTASYRTPSGIPFLDDIVLTLGVPTLNATNAYLEANLTLADIIGGNLFNVGGSMTCNGGFLKLNTRIHFDGFDFYMPQGVVDFANGVIDVYNAVPLVDDIDHINNPLTIGAIDQPLEWNIIPRFC